MDGTGKALRRRAEIHALCFATDVDVIRCMMNLQPSAAAAIQCARALVVWRLCMEVVQHAVPSALQPFNLGVDRVFL